MTNSRLKSFKSAFRDVFNKKGGLPEDSRQGFDMKNIAEIAKFIKPNPVADPAKWLEHNIKASASLAANSLISEVVTMTPELAKTILEACNGDNRGVRLHRVKAYSKAMSEGRWKLTAQGVSFSRDGHLNDGQHRLFGIVDAGVSVPMVVTFGEDRDVFDILDTGATRNASDTLKIAGFKHTSNAAAAARVLKMIEAGTMGSNTSYGNDEILDWVTEHDDIEDYTAAGTNIGQKLKTSRAGVTAAFYLIGNNSAHSNYLDQFIASLSDGVNLEKRSPILVLREGLMRKNFVVRTHPGIAPAIIAATTINAWNLWVRSKSASHSTLSWRVGFPFPVAR